MDTRHDNYKYLFDRLHTVNKLELKKEIPGPFAYPLLIDEGNVIRKKMIECKIYIPTLWPDVLGRCKEEDVEYQFAQNILPLPVDQRYDKNDMEYIITMLKSG